MDPINVFFLVNLLLTMGANLVSAKASLKSSLTKVVDKPKIYLQKVPIKISALILILIILGLFQIGTLSHDNFQINTKENAGYSNLLNPRIIALLVYILFSWLQVLPTRTLGKLYSQDIVILKEHKLINKGLYKFIRHPQYLSQVISDLAAGVVLLSYLIVPLALLVELPLFILRGRFEDKLLEKHFKKDFVEYKKKTGFMIPFIG